jgi:hypothetical protein
MNPRNDGDKVMLGIIVVLIAMFLGSSLMIYDLRRDNQTLSQRIDTNEENIEANETFTVSLSQVQMKDTANLISVDTEYQRRISLLEESIEPKNFRWAKIKAVRDVIVQHTRTNLTIVEFTTIAGAVVDYSEENDVSISLILAVMKAESAFNPRAVSHAGALGLLQIMPATAEEISSEVGRKRYHLFDISHNVQFGSYYLWKLLNRFDGDIEAAVRAYNCGPVYVEKVLSRDYREYPQETLEYSEKVLMYKEEFDRLGL